MQRLARRLPDSLFYYMKQIAPCYHRCCQTKEQKKKESHGLGKDGNYGTDYK